MESEIMKVPNRTRNREPEPNGTELAESEEEPNRTGTSQNFKMLALTEHTVYKFLQK